MNNPSFEILICHMPWVKERVASFGQLISALGPQCRRAAAMGVEVSIQIHEGLSLEWSVGVKRNKLLSLSKADYIAFVDDDDMVSDNYVARILLALSAKPDVVGFWGHLHHRNKPNQSPELFIHSMRYDHWFEEPNHIRGGKTYYRSPNHLNPVKRELAIAAGFPDISHGEDHDYSKRLLPLLKTESMIDSVMYHYRTV